jgi:hypothetical protein
MRRAFVLSILLFLCFAAVSSFAADETKTGEPFACPRAVNVEVGIKTAGSVTGWDAIPARSTFTLAIKEGAVRGTTMICHYTNGTVDYNLTRVFPKGKTCHIAPNQSFMCQ